MGQLSNVRPVSLATGIASYVPGLMPIIKKAVPSGRETSSYRYCYAVWMRHLVMARNNGYRGPIDTVAELGPGASLGTGIAALLSGAQHYYALDVMGYASRRNNVDVFDGLAEMFRAREAIPDEKEFPRLRPALPSYEFPRGILTDDIIERSLEQGRLDRLRKELGAGGDNEHFRYYVPWHDDGIISQSVVDMIFSQAVMMQVQDLPHTYRAIARWLKPGGITSHAIDFSSLGTAKAWNGHWSYGDRTWKLIMGKRAYLTNRQPHSCHVRLLEENGFRITCDVTTKSKAGIARDELAPQFRDMNTEDLETTGAFIQAIKGD